MDLLKFAYQMIVTWFNSLPRCLRWVACSAELYCISKGAVLLDRVVSIRREHILVDEA